VTSAIEVSGLTMSYGDREVLRGVDFDVRTGEVFCLLGPNGAGKTTTVEILEGFRRRTGGTVSVLGLDPQAQPTRLRERIGMVLQECGFPRQARVAELIDIWRSYYRKPRDLEDLLQAVELTQDRKTQVRKLSGGQRRRLDLALALAGDPELIFLDEPTTGFDPESRRRCWAAIENLRALGKTIVLTTHYLDEAERLADRVAILAEGRIQIAGTVRHVARQAGVSTTIKFTAPERVRNGTLAPPASLAVVVRGETAVCTPASTAVSTAASAATALRDLLNWAAANDLGDLEDLSVESPTLEDAYLRLVCPPAGERPPVPPVTAPLEGRPLVTDSLGERPAVTASPGERPAVTASPGERLATSPATGGTR
jgi:ABC-2 type transport system ATP-binding protein